MNNGQKLAGKIAVITGGNSGIGLATAKRFVEEGAHVVITGRREKELKEAAALIGKNVTTVVGDVTRLEDLDRLFAVVKEKHGHIDVLFANAGWGEVGPLEAATEAHFDKTFDLNAKGTFFTVQKALPFFKDGGSIVLNSSVANVRGDAAFLVTVPPPSGLADESIKRMLPWLVAVAFFMQALDTTILNTAVPAIAKALAVTPLSMKAVLASYTLSLAVFIPISGWMADRFGTRRVFASAIGLFTLGSLLCGISSNINFLVACRILQGCGGAMMVPVGRLTMVRTFPKSELVRAMSFVAIPGLIGPMLGPIAGGLIVAYFQWRVIFFINLPIGLLGLYLVYRHLPDYREKEVHPLDIPGLLLFGSGIGLLSYVLEVFGEHTLSWPMIVGLLALSAVLLTGYGLRATRTEFPLLRLTLFRLRTFRAAVSGSFFTRLGIGGIPFLFPLLYQVGLGFTPIQSGLLMVPQAFAAMSLKITMPIILRYLGYRRVLLSNTVIIGLMITLFATIGVNTPVWLIVAQLFVFGFFTSLQYTSMNTLVYSDVTEKEASGASTIASTAQQMSISFGVAVASLATVFFIPNRAHTNGPEMIQGIHEAFLVLGGWTVFTALIFRELKSDDGDSVSQHKVLPTVG